MLGTRTVLQLLQTVCRRVGLPVPTLYLSSTNDQVLQLGALLEELLEDLRQYEFPELRRTASFPSIAQEEQGLLTALANDTSLLALYKQTFWNLTLQQPVAGPVLADEWHRMKAGGLTGGYPMFRILEGSLHLYPVPVAGQTYTFEYKSGAVVIHTDGTSGSTITSDEDMFRFSDALLLSGLRMKWKAEKGLDFEREYAEYQGHLMNEIGDSNGKNATLRMDGCPAALTLPTAIIIPIGGSPIVT